MGYEYGANRFVGRDFFEKLRGESFSSARGSEERLQSWVSRLYSLLLSMLRDPLTRGSIERFVQGVCRDISVKMLGVDLVPQSFPLDVDELVRSVSTAVQKVIKEKVDEYVNEGLVEPTSDSVVTFSRVKTLEVLGTCFEHSLIRLGVVV
jgi:hypothetical protein